MIRSSLVRPILLVLAACALPLAGCAKKAQDISASYVPVNKYDAYLCSQLRGEAARVSTRVADVFGDQNLKSSVGAFIYWPKAAVGRGNASDAEVAQLKGEMVAIEQASNAKNCGIQFASADSAAPRYDAGGVKVDARANIGNSLYNLPPRGMLR